MGERASIGSWGPAAWTLYHTVSFKYPVSPSQDDRQKAFDFLYGIAHMLPCRHCREHWTRYIRVHVATPMSSKLASRDAFARFLVQGHNDVNRRLGRPTVPFDVVREWYDSSEETSELFPRMRKTAWLVAFIIVVVMIVALCASDRSARRLGLRAL